uniref:Methyltransferase type 11 domain-containing protein n=1 Tax=Entomoneis paludosa TaxID=265537 RepID=A0A7S2YSX7_9STRA
MDIGCGRGISTLWFHLQGLDTLCVEGSHDAVQQSLLPDVASQVVQHDYSRGPWWPEKTYDATWAVEFLEHVGVNYHFNYITTMRKSAMIFATSSRRGGWHHVEVHPDDWWIRKFESYGFIYDDKLTQQIRVLMRTDQSLRHLGGPKWNGAYVRLSLKVFINPVVAALPQHAHLFHQHGCFQSWKAGIVTNRPCQEQNGESALPQSFWPLEIDPKAEEEWGKVLLNSTNLTDLE